MSQIQAGRYAAEATAANVGESKTKGTPGVFLTFQIDGGGTIDATLWLSEKAFERSVEVLREVFGFDDNFDTVEGQIVGKRCSITVEMEADKNDSTKFWPRVKWINPEREAPKPVASDFLAQLSAKAARIVRTTPAPPPKPSAPAPEKDEDIPF